MRHIALALIAAALVAGSGCGGGDDPPSKLSHDDAQRVVQARERLDDAIDTEETLRTSPAEARHIVRGVRALARTGALEGPARDKFSRAALRRVSSLAPSLVLRSPAQPGRLDSPATIAFLARAEHDPPGALLLPAQREVDLIATTMDRAGAGAKTRVPAAGGGQTAERFLRSTEHDVRPIWPSLARRLAAARHGLD